MCTGSCVHARVPKLTDTHTHTHDNKRTSIDLHSRPLQIQPEGFTYEGWLTDRRLDGIIQELGSVPATPAGEDEARVQDQYWSGSDVASQGLRSHVLGLLELVPISVCNRCPRCDASPCAFRSLGV